MQNGKCSLEYYKSYKNRFTLLLRNAKKDYFTNYSNKHKSNTKAVWSLINNYLNKTKNVKDCMISAEEMNNYFASAGPNSVKHLKTPTQEQSFQYMPVSLCNSFFIEILSCVQTLKGKLSSGFDNISMYFIKKIIHQIVHPLSKIINKSFSLGLFPSYVKLLKLFLFLNQVKIMNVTIIGLYHFCYLSQKYLKN